MTIHGYEIVGDWENSTCGKIASATKGGKKYFLKKYQTPVAPMDSGTLNAKTFAHNKKLFEDFVDFELDKLCYAPVPVHAVVENERMSFSLPAAGKGKMVRYDRKLPFKA